MSGIARNFFAAYDQGLQRRAVTDQMQQQNALADFYKSNGQALMDGDQNALAGLAQIGPQGFQAAYGMQRQIRADERAEEAHRLRVQSARAAAGRAAAAERQRLSAEQAAAEAARARAYAFQLDAALQQGPEALSQFAAANAEAVQQAGFDPAAFTPENAQIALAGLIAVHDGLAGGLGDAREVLAGPGAAAEPAAIQSLRIRAQEAGLEPGTPAYQEFMRSGGRVQPSRVVMGADGNPVYLEGEAAIDVKFTEGQSKDNVYSTRARGALEVLEPVADSLSSLGDRAANLDPTGLARGLQSDDFQVAEQAGTEFLQAILRKDTGAAITLDETESYGRVYLPQVGDGPAVLEAKRQARIRAVNALEAGMSSQQMLARDRALVRAAEEAGTSAPRGRPPATGQPTQGGVPQTSPAAPTSPPQSATEQLQGQADQRGDEWTPPTWSAVENFISHIPPDSLRDEGPGVAEKRIDQLLSVDLSTLTEAQAQQLLDYINAARAAQGSVGNGQ